MMALDRRPLALLAALALGAPRIAAQCPTGTPRPCQQPPPRRLDDHLWLVLPFQNTAHVVAGDLIRDASGHLLYTDLSRWEDVHVVDDQRVDDLTRSAHDGAPQTFSLERALVIARTAGARNLVVGDFLASGTTARVTARVYDARSGRRVRTAAVRIAPYADLDSLTNAFGRIARDLLAVPPPAGATLGAIGTRSVSAYRAYLTGVAALNRFRVDTAVVYLRQAIAADSAFGLAYYKLSLTQNWIAPKHGEERAIDLAARLSGPLPARERALIAGLQAMRNAEYPRACATYRALASADSNDVEALYGLGDCNFHDQVPVPGAGDTTRFTLRGSRTQVLRSMTRATEIDPAFQPPYEHLMHVLLQDRFVAACARTGCTQRGTATVLVTWDHDTLVTDVRSPAQRSMGMLDTMALRFATRRIGLPRADAVSARWIAVAPESEYAHLLRSETLAALNDLPGAERELRLAAGVNLGRLSPVTIALRRAVFALRQWHTADAAALVDSLLASADTSSRSATNTLALIAGRYRAGNRTRADSARGTIVALMNGALGTDTVREAADHITHIIAEGVPLNGRDAYVAFLMRSLSLLGGAYSRALDTPLDPASPDPVWATYGALQRGDTARARRALARFDAVLQGLDRDVPDNGGWLLSAEAHLALLDTASALAQMRTWENRFRAFLPSDGIIIGVAGWAGSYMWGRGLLLYADLLAAAGDGAKARSAYEALVGLWSGGDPEVQPFVAHARTALMRLGR